MLNRLRSLYADLMSGTPMVSDSTTARSGDRSGDTSTGSAGDTDAGSAGDTDAEATGGDDVDLTPTPGLESSGSWHDLLDGEEVSKQEVQLELGLQPHEFLVWLVRDAGGQMWQADMVEATGWSKSTVSRYLDTLESSGIVERVWIGRRKLVGVPGEMPDPISVSEGPTDGMSADTQTRVADGPP